MYFPRYVLFHLILLSVIIVKLEFLGPSLQLLRLGPESGQALIAVRAKLAEILEHLQLEELPVRGVVYRLGLPFLVRNHVVPRPQETHFLGNVRVVGMPIDAARDICLLQDGRFHLVVVCSASGREERLEGIKEQETLHILPDQSKHVARAVYILVLLGQLQK